MKRESLAKQHQTDERWRKNKNFSNQHQSERQSNNWNKASFLLHFLCFFVFSSSPPPASLISCSLPLHHDITFSLDTLSLSNLLRLSRFKRRLNLKTLDLSLSPSQTLKSQIFFLFHDSHGVSFPSPITPIISSGLASSILSFTRHLFPFAS